MSEKIEIEKVPSLPERKALGRRVKEYDELINKLLKQEKGIYKVNVKGKTLKTLYSALIKRVAGKPLKLHQRQNVIFIEKTE